MRGYRFVDPPFVPVQSDRDRRATRIALHQSTGERGTEQRQAILRQTEDQDGPQIRQRFHADIEVHLADGRDVRAARIPINDRPAASISTVTACVVRTNIEQRQARGHHPGQFRVLGRDVRSRFEG